MDTGVLGGVPVPSQDELAAMQRQPYVLRARGGELSQAPARKVPLPHDPHGHVQRTCAALAPDGTIYVNQNSILCKSTDAGQSWSWYPRQDSPQQGGRPVPGTQVFPYSGPFVLLDDGTFVLAGANDGITADPLLLMASDDEGRTWREHSCLELPDQYDERYVHSLTRLSGGALLLLAACRDHLRWEPETSGTVHLLAYRSTDGGATWQGPGKVCDFGHEGGVAELASGGLLAVIRYQRPLLPTDPPDLVQRMGGREVWPYKHIFLADSPDGGETWTDFRQLTTVFGQCFGFPAALDGGTIVLAHDTRYGPGAPSGRAMVSHDGGRVWEDEVYYLYYGGAISGYSHSLVLEDGVILTIAGTSEHGPGKTSWNALIGHSDLTAIRWRPWRQPPQRLRP